MIRAILRWIKKMNIMYMLHVNNLLAKFVTIASCLFISIS